MDNTMLLNYRYNSKNEEKKAKIIEIFTHSDYGVTVTYNEVNEVLRLNLDDYEKYDENMKYIKNFVGNLKNLLIKRRNSIKNYKRSRLVYFKTRAYFLLYL